MLGANYPGSRWYERAFKLMGDHPAKPVAPLAPGEAPVQRLGRPPEADRQGRPGPAPAEPIVPGMEFLGGRWIPPDLRQHRDAELVGHLRGGVGSPGSDQDQARGTQFGRGHERRQV